MSDDNREDFELKDHVCRTPECYRSFHTARGREYHEERGNHDPGARDD